MLRLPTLVTLVSLTSLLAGCGDGSDLLLPGGGDPATVVMVSGDSLNGRVGEPLAQPLVAKVTDEGNRPIEGAKVVFVFTGEAPGAVIAPDTSMTDAKGEATASVTLGTRPGTQPGEVRALGASGSPTATATFTLTALPENANGIRAVAGEGQSAPVNAQLPQPLVVEVTDAFGNPIAGMPVTWTVEGGGSVSEASTTTGDDGRTSVTRVLGGAAGTQHTLASAGELAGSPVTFEHTAMAGAASGVTILSGNGQSGSINTELPLPLTVQVRDAGTNPVPNVAVTWVIGSGSGSVTPTTSTTDANGVATAAWTLGPLPGANTLSAVVSGIGVAEFTATATGGAPARLTVLTQPSSSAVIGVVLGQQPVIQLVDALGNPARQSGVEVNVAIGSGGGSLAGTTFATSDGEGRATFAGLALLGGGGTRTLRFSADGFASVTSAQINVTLATTVTTITGDAPDPSVAGAEVTVQFTVTSTSGTPTGTVRVRDGGDECSGELSGGQGSCTLTLSNTGDRTLTAEYLGADGFARSSDNEGHSVQAPPAPELAVVRQPSATATVGTPFDQQPSVQLRTADGTDIGTSGVSVSAAIVSGGGTLVGATTVTTDGSGRADFTDLAITGEPGQRTLVFTADGFANASSDPIDVQAAPPAGTTTTITSADPNPSPAGTAVVVQFTVTSAAGTPEGSVTVTDGVDSCSGDLSGGAGNCSITLSTTGERPLTATFTPSGGGFAASTSPAFSHQVDAPSAGVRASARGTW